MLYNPSMGSTYCIFAAHFLPNMGGIENYTQNLASQLIADGNRVIVVTSNPGGHPTFETSANGIEIVRLPSHRLLRGRYPIPKKSTEYKKAIAWLDDTNIDYVVVNARFYLHSLEGLALAQRKGVHPVVIDHGSAHVTMGNRVFDVAARKVEHLLTVKGLRYGADYYGVSDASVQWLRHFGVEAKGVLNNSLDSDSFAAAASNRDFRSELDLPEGAFVVAFTGRLVPEKGVRALLEAARILQPRGDVHFLLAGDGPLRDELESQAPSNLHLLGRLSHPDVAAMLLQADAFCLPTRSEGFATSLLEAAACSCAPIITDVGGVKELIPSPDFGIVLSSVNGTEAAQAVAALADDRERCARLAANINERVRADFSWKKTADAVQAACEKANRAY